MAMASVEHSSMHVKDSENFFPESELIGYYSIDIDRQFLHNSSRMRYYNPPEEMKVYTDISRGVHFDLDEGVDAALRRDISFLNEGLDHLLQWIKINHRRIKAPANTGRWIRPKFVCSRGVLTNLLCSRVIPKRTWIIFAVRWKGTIYLCLDKTLQIGEMADDRLMKFGSWGHKFEQYVLSKSPDELPDTTKPVLETEEFRCVCQRNIGSHSVMFSSVMKGVLSNKPLKTPLPFKELKFIDLATNRIIECAVQEKNFRKFKMLKWWSQCYLTNTKQVLCGFRNDTGVVYKLSLYNFETIIEEGKLYWNPAHCIHGCKSLLTIFEKTVVRDCDETIYKFEKGLDGNMNISELPASSEYAFLPASFLAASG